MNSAVVAVSVLVLYLAAYRFYSKFISERVFGIRNDEPTPAHEMRDGVDYVAAGKHVLFGHHFASIAGAAPIIGPAIAVFWGWLPAIVWVVLGTIFIGAVHDFGALVISARNRGRSIGDLAATYISPRGRTLFLLVVYFLLFFVIAVFAYAISVLFVNFPESVLPVNFQIFVAVAIGVLFYRKKIPILWPSIIALLFLYFMVWTGTKVPLTIPEVMGSQVVTWIVILLVYSFAASVLPVWVLLQPRDYINGIHLFVGLSIIIAGIMAGHPQMQAPAINFSAEGMSVFPFLFITIACGAVSGFHGLVSSGTTSKQLDRMSHSRFIGYGGMLGEGTLAMVATLAVAAGIDRADWLSHYDSWESASSGGIANFVTGTSTFLASIHIPEILGTTLISVIVISFAATSLDTASRIQRLVIGELGSAYGIDVLKNRYIGAFFAVVPPLLLCLFAEVPGKGPGSGGFLLWPLFGATNQLIAGLTLLVLTIYLWRSGRPFVYTLVPTVFLVVMTTAAIGLNMKYFLGNPLLFGLSVATLVLAVWLVLEAFSASRKKPGGEGG